jgi:lipid II:glycine glycyltransferase (peptidoglycan interpeptide bridge formation enzyme)
MVDLNDSNWKVFLEAYPNAHLLQTAEWGALKSAFGWRTQRVVGKQGGAQILFRQLPLGFTIAYLPKGPVGDQWEELWPKIDEICREQRAVFLKVEPDIWKFPGEKVQPNPPRGFQLSPHTVQPPRTIVVSLQGEEDDILARMKQKTRYNIRLSVRKGVQVKLSDDLQTFQELLEITGDREQFGVHSLAYYRKLYNLFHNNGDCILLIAYFESEPLGGVMVFARGERAWYLHGASTNRHRNFMPNYLLQWEAIRWSAARGCTSYDLWGVPDENLETLEASFTHRSDGLWGVYRFKRGFGGQVLRAAGPWDKIYNPVLYKAYQWWVNRRSSGGIEA